MDACNIITLYNSLNHKTLTKEDYDNFMNTLDHVYHLTSNDINNIFDIKYIITLKNNVCLEFQTCENTDKLYIVKRNIRDQLTDEQKKYFDQYEYLFGLPQPIQKSKEWFNLRNNMITASNCGAVIGECEHSSIKEVLLDKIGFGKKYTENEYVYHGKKYEKIATMIYEKIYNTKIGEFGLIQHKTIPFLGASPDGISMSVTLDFKPNKLIGRMLEIKCPPKRVIQTQGKIKGTICPGYYWIQVQIQLECCNLDKCDFWQCLITEYKNEQDFIDDKVNTFVHTENFVSNQTPDSEINEEPYKIGIDETICKGVIMELLPIDRSIIPKGNLAIWYGKYIYPPKLMSVNDYLAWKDFILNNLNKLYPELISKYKFSRFVYWKLEKSHNQLIERQQLWFDQHKKMYEKFWNRVLYYRTHKLEAEADIRNQRLSNDVFLLTETEKIPKIESIKKFRDNKEENTNSHKLKKQPTDSESEEIFLSSDSKEQTNKKNENKLKLGAANEIRTNKKNSNKLNKPKISVMPVIPVMPVMSVHNSTNKKNDDNLELIIVKENRKKK